MSLVRINYSGLDFAFDAGDEDDYIRRQIAQTGTFFETPLLEYIKRHYPEHGTIVDAGANFGNHSLFFSHFLKHEYVVCFEPCPQTFDRLRRNMEGLCDLYPVALGDHEAMAVGAMAETDNAGTFTLREDGAGDIPIRTLDSFGLHNVTLIKIDVEWMELQVLLGGIETIASSLPVIFAEGHGHGYVAPMADLLKPLGYECIHMLDLTGDGTSWMFRMKQ